MKRGEWHRKELIDKELGSKVIIFSKSYKGHLVDVLVVEKDKGYYVSGRAFKKRGEKLECRYNSPEIFFTGSDAYEKASDYAVKECIKIENTIDAFLSKIE
jgi:hypothetical protein